MNSSDEAVNALVETLVAELGQRGPTYRRALHRLAAAVRAEAVADERRRIIEAIDAVRVEYEGYGVPELWRGGMRRAVTIVRGLAAGSVPVATPPAEPAARVTRESIQRVADAILAEPFRPAPSQPVTCEHGWTEKHMTGAWPRWHWCPEQLATWENAVGWKGYDWQMIAATLIDEVRASHAREAAARADAKEADYVCRATGDKLAAVRGQRDVLQQRIDKALEVCDKFDPPGRLPPITFDGTPFPSAARSLRAALTGTENQSTEETP